MKDDVSALKIESLRRCVKRLEEKCPGSAEALISDYDLQDIISVNLERAVQISVDIGSRLLVRLDEKPPETMGEIFPLLSEKGILKKDLAKRLAKAVGFRNISVHEYQKIDWNIVFSIIRNNLKDFKNFAAAVSKNNAI